MRVSALYSILVCICIGIQFGSSVLLLNEFRSVPIADYSFQPFVSISDETTTANHMKYLSKFTIPSTEKWSIEGFKIETLGNVPPTTNINIAFLDDNADSPNTIVCSASATRDSISAAAPFTVTFVIPGCVLDPGDYWTQILALNQPDNTVAFLMGADKGSGVSGRQALWCGGNFNPSNSLCASVFSNLGNPNPFQDMSDENIYHVRTRWPLLYDLTGTLFGACCENDTCSQTLPGDCIGGIFDENILNCLDAQTCAASSSSALSSSSVQSSSTLASSSNITSSSMSMTSSEEISSSSDMSDDNLVDSSASSMSSFSFFLY